MCIRDRNKIGQNAKTRDFAFRAPSACLPRAFRHGSVWICSVSARLRCGEARGGEWRLGSDSFWRGSALLGTGSARLRFVNELFFFSPTFFELNVLLPILNRISLSLSLSLIHSLSFSLSLILSLSLCLSLSLPLSLSLSLSLSRSLLH